MHPLALLSLAVALSLAAGTLHAQPLEGPNPEALRTLRESLGRGATVEYESVSLVNQVRSKVSLAVAGDDEYLLSNGMRLKEFVLQVGDSRNQYSPPIPLAKFPLEAGATWRHSGLISERFGLRASQVDSHFTVKGPTRLATAAGPREAVEVHELRRYAGHEVSARHWVDAQTGLMLKRTWKVLRFNRFPHANEIQAPAADYEITVTRIP